MRFAHGIATLSAAAILAVSPTASAVQTPSAFARRPPLEVAQGAPVRLAGTLAWHQVPAQHRRAWSRMRAELGAQTWAVWDGDTDVVRRIWGAGVAAPDSVRSAVTAERIAREFLGRHIALLAPGAAVGDFVLVANEYSQGSKMRTLGFAQRAGGLQVAGGQVSFRFRDDRLFMIGSEALPHVPAPRARAIGDGVAAAAALEWVQRDLAPAATVKAIDATMVLPLVRAGRPEYATVVPVEVASAAPRGVWRVYVDAVSGQPVAREQTLRFATGKVAYDAPVRQPGGARQEYQANRAALTVAGMNVESNATGDVMWGGNNPTTVTTRVTGAQVAVNNEAGAEATGNLNLGAGQTAVWDVAGDEQVDAQIATFVHTNVVIDYARGIAPELGFLGQQLDANVNINDSCNAYYDGQSINFFGESQQCNNTGRIADIVYHEFGHALHDRAVIPGVGNFDGALSEGISDYLAATITGDPGMGGGFFLNNDAPLRHIDPMNDEAVWPDDISGDTHITGLIIAGALWDLRKALVEDQGPGGVAVADHIFYESIRRAVDIPTMYFEALAADDDDGDLGNGTPNMCLINEAFARHGLFKLGVEVSAPGVALPLLANYKVTVGLTGGDVQCQGSAIESAALTWRLREQPDVGGVIPMTIAADQITGEIPQQPAGSVVQYQVTLGFSDASEASYPDNRADPFYEFFVGAVEPIYCTDFETDPAADGWTHGLSMGEAGEGADDWMWAEPMAPGSSGDPQAAYDGSRVFGNDLGGGNYNGLYQSSKVNFARSPTIDTSGYSEVRLQYRRWLTVEDGHFDRATIYANDGVVWQNRETPNMDDATVHHTDREWRFHDVDLTDSVVGDAVTLQYEIQSDQGLEMGGWTLDALCVVGVVEGPAAICGDAIVSVGEACDDGPDNSDTEVDACRTDCSAAACGDGVVDSGEECDDGNVVSGDGCEASCVTASPTTSDSDGTTTESAPTTGGGEAQETGDSPATDTDASGSGGSDSATSGAMGSDDGCGCQQSGPGGASLAGLALLLLGRRRRRG